MKPTNIGIIADLLGRPMRGEAIVRGVAVDSRLVKPGDLFFALPGAKVDGHLFLEEVAGKGAVGAVVHTTYNGGNFGMSLLKSDDVLISLQDLTRKVIEIESPRIVGITGSLGKTTTKEFITVLLKSKFNVASSPGNSNSQIGLPLAVLNHSSAANEILVLEMGMTLPGHIKKLVSIAAPEIAIVTKVALVHACSFDSIEEIARAKGEIFSHPRTKMGIYHKESDFGGMLSGSGSCVKRTFSTTCRESEYFLETLPDGIGVIESLGRKNAPSMILPPLHVPGKHNNHNFLAAVTVARYFGVSWSEIARAEDNLFLPERRLQFIEKNGVTFVNDAYNASELSMKAALETLPEPVKGGKKIAVLGGMVELGKFSEECHRAVALHALDHVDELLCFGEDCRMMQQEWLKAGRKVFWSEDRAGIVRQLGKVLKQGDVVLLKGSRSKEVNKVLEEL